MRKIAFSGRFCSVRTPTYGFARAISTIREAVPPSSQDLGAVHAADTGIVSSDIVGYNTQTIEGSKLSCVTFQFAEVGTATENATIASLSTTGLSAGDYDSMETDAPCIMIYNGVGYDYYYYISDAFDAEGNEVTSWADHNGDVASDAVSLGTGFWLRVPEATCDTGTLTQAGKVNADATTTLQIASGLTLAGNPYPTALNLSKITTAGLVAGVYETMETDAPCVMIYNGVGYNYYYYISDAYNADGDEVTTWADHNGDESTDDIAAIGTAFWMRTTSTGSLTFSL